MSDKRNSSFELLRIVSMIMIVFLHFNMFGGMLKNTYPSNWKYYMAWIIEYTCIIAVNIYVLISRIFPSIIKD